MESELSMAKSTVGELTMFLEKIACEVHQELGDEKEVSFNSNRDVVGTGCNICKRRQQGPDRKLTITLQRRLILEES